MKTGREILLEKLKVIKKETEGKIMRQNRASRKGEIEAEILLEVIVRGEYLPGSGTSDLRVFLGEQDITDRLSKSELQALGTDFEERLRDEEEHGN